MKQNSWIEYSSEAKAALHDAQPLVALETTLISHGMPYPQNIETALSVEDIIRTEGAIPATIGILAGKIKIGLNHQELEVFAQREDVVKVSRRDLSFALNQKQTGGTTVAGTMICAQLANIPVFVTGGIGGVHRQGETTLDISADLIELSQTPVAVVCAGIKSVLDIPKTLEFLETYGVPVIGYQTEDFPAFYTRSSGCKAQVALPSPEAIAHFMKMQWDLGLKGGLVIGNPVPEDNEMDHQVIQNAIDQAIGEASQQQIVGKEVTPYLLDRIQILTAGKSLQTNAALLENNAKVGAQIAKAYTPLKSVSP